MIYCFKLFKALNYVGCFRSFSSVDVFEETLNSTQCNAAANFFSGTCYKGNCDSNDGECQSNKCPNPFGGCIYNNNNNNCNKCSATYNYVYLNNMKNEICVQICTSAGFNYSGTVWGFVI